MKVFYNPLQRDSQSGGLAIIPDNSSGGTAIEGFVASGSAKILAVSDGDVNGLTCSELKIHIERGHCRVDDDDQIYLLDESEWSENILLVEPTQEQE